MRVDFSYALGVVAAGLLNSFRPNWVDSSAAFGSHYLPLWAGHCRTRLLGAAADVGGDTGIAASSSAAE